jgi:hypothetical protein
MRRPLHFALALLFLCAASFCAFAQKDDAGTIEPLRSPGLDNQVYVGFERVRYDYGLVMPNGSVQRANTNGVNFQYNYRKFDHVSLIGTARYGTGSPLNQSLTTVAGGAGYVLFWKRYEPFAQILAGMARLSSDHAAGNMHLYDGPRAGFTTLVGAGCDITLTERWGVRPIYIETQYLPFGTKNSTFWNVSAGVLYRFGHSKRAR